MTGFGSVNFMPLKVPDIVQLDSIWSNGGDEGDPRLRRFASTIVVGLWTDRREEF